MASMSAESEPFVLESVPLDSRHVRMHLSERSAPISWKRACELLRTSEKFREMLGEALAQAPFEAFFWECPAVSRATIDESFRWVLVESPALAGARTDERAFSEHLDRSRGVKSFWNLGRDARLIAPCRGADPSAYPHLAAFVRSAPREQVQRFLQVLGDELEARLAGSDEPFWVSTSGLGVYWLHVRLDERPKYYTYAPFCRLPQG